jgi:hypothetical protein
MPLKLLIKYASRQRPKRFFDGLDTIIDLAYNKEDYTVFAILDKDDPEIRAYISGLEDNEKYSKVIRDVGFSTSKINAINRPTPEIIEWDILVNFSDDQRFVLFGYDEIIRQFVEETAPDTDGLFFFPDQDAKDALITMSIIGKKYFMRDGWVYHPDYISIFADNHAMDMAKIRGKLFYNPTMIALHLNPAYGHLEKDTMFLQQQQVGWTVDQETYINIAQQILTYDNSITIYTYSNHS